jgi:murein L,D-transpeptidase YcbB/YkuD
MVRKFPLIPALFGLIFLISGCRSADQTPAITAELQTRLEAKPEGTVPADVWKDVRAFYTQRETKPAWVEHKHVQKQAADVLLAIRSASSHGFAVEEYGEAEIVRRHAALAEGDKDAPDRIAQLAEYELLLTTNLMRLGRDVAIGRTTPKTISSLWEARRNRPDLAASLAGALPDNVSTWLDTIRPPHAEYAALQKALVSLQGQADKGGWPTVPKKPLKPGVSDPSVVALRQRLVADGHLAADQAKTASPQYDGDVEAAVKAFQERHAIKATGQLDAKTLDAMNVDIDQRIAQVRINLERWRWMPDDLGAQHFLVNIPQYHVIAREQGKPVMDIRVVVGKPGNETPIFSDEMEFVVFSPYWNIPDSIVDGETVPALARDPGYLARNNMEVVRAGRVVDPSSVNWSDPSTRRSIAIRQRPGSDNALGHVKFLFPNDHDVYLHDTPADSLFGRPSRAFSHGCVRVEEPERLAQYVLRDQSEWTGDAIRKAMYSGNERHVKLDRKIPVHIAYFTAWVDERGGLHFQEDVYGYDKKQLAGAAPAPKRERTTE